MYYNTRVNVVVWVCTAHTRTLVRGHNLMTMWWNIDIDIANVSYSPDKAGTEITTIAVEVYFLLMYIFVVVVFCFDVA